MNDLIFLWISLLFILGIYAVHNGLKSFKNLKLARPWLESKFWPSITSSGMSIKAELEKEENDATKSLLQKALYHHKMASIAFKLWIFIMIIMVVLIVLFTYFDL